MKMFFLYVLFALIAISVQSTLFSGVKPDLALVLVFFYSLRSGQIKGMVYGAVLGLLLDTAGGSIVGPHIAGNAFTGYFVAAVRQGIFQWNMIIHAVAIILFSAIDTLLVYLCYQFFSDVSAYMSLKTAIGQIGYTTAAGCVLYPLLIRWPMNEQRWGAL